MSERNKNKETQRKKKGKRRKKKRVIKMMDKEIGEIEKKNICVVILQKEK